MSWRNCSLDLVARLGAWRKAFTAKLLAAALLPFALGGCGFEPIAATPEAFGEEDLVLAQLDVQANDPRFAYRLKKEMLRSIAIDTAASQSFSVNTSITRAGLAIEQNDTITRRNVTANTSYALADRRNQGDGAKAEAITGTSTINTAVNTTASQYSANVSDREAVERLARETARRLITFLRVNRPSERPYGG